MTGNQIATSFGLLDNRQNRYMPLSNTDTCIMRIKLNIILVRSDETRLI